jgi:hypothetical protein
LRNKSAGTPFVDVPLISLQLYSRIPGIIQLSVFRTIVLIEGHTIIDSFGINKLVMGSL